MRHIDADALLDKLPDDLPYKASVKRVLMQAPAADVVEVVRCKDCKHYVAGDEVFASHCRLYGAQAYDDDFCSHGERREEQ